jgi:cell division protein FtsB
MNNEPVSRQYCSTLERIVVRQQSEIEKVNAEWVQAAMALGKCVQENHSLKAEIEVLKENILNMETREPFLWELL